MREWGKEFFTVWLPAFRRTALCLLVLLGLSLPASVAQNRIVKLLLENRIQELEKIHKSPSLLKKLDAQSRRVLTALFTTDAQVAVATYERFVHEHPETEYVPVLLEKIGEYQFARGLYNTARATFSYLVRKYPNHRLADRARLQWIRCWQAIGQQDSVRKLLRQFSSYRVTKQFALLSSVDLSSREAESYQDGYRARRKTETSGGIFTLQTGAFSSYSNAKIQKQFLENKGYRADIFSKEVGGRRYFVVCVGSYGSEGEARRKARLLKRRYGIRARIVRFSELKRL